MPEGDTVLVAAHSLGAALSGHTLTRTDLRVPKLATVTLAGRRVLDVGARGKHLLCRVEGGLTLHSHFEMDGAWILRPAGQRLPEPAHEVRAVLTTEAAIAVGMRLKKLALVESRLEEKLLAHLGPDVLGPDWDPHEVLMRMRATPARPIGAVLLDQRVLAGPGNVYKSEICWLAGLDPRTPVGEAPDLRAVLSLTKRVMEANRTTGRQVTTGDPRPGRDRWVYGRARRACRRCGTLIERFDMVGFGGDRVTFWCPSCQPRFVPASWR